MVQKCGWVMGAAAMMQEHFEQAWSRAVRVSITTNPLDISVRSDIKIGMDAVLGDKHVRVSGKSTTVF